MSGGDEAGFGVLREVAPGVHEVRARQRYMGLEVGARMTVLETRDGLLVHSPVGVDPGVVSRLGGPGRLLAPNLLHHLYVGPWIEAGWVAWAAPGLAAKRPDLTFEGTIEGDANPFGPDIGLLPMSCFAMTNEVAVLHRLSRTLVVTDLVFNLAPTMPWRTRAMMRALGGYPGCRVTLLERLGMDREAARRELGALETWDFDRLIMAHGEVIEEGGKEALLGAFGWLG